MFKNIDSTGKTGRHFAMIACVDQQWGIGKDGRQLVTIPEDMQMFRRATMGRIVVMGRKTFQTFGAMRPLEGRLNVILSQNPSFNPKDAYVVSDLEEALDIIDRLKKENDLGDEDVVIIGGGEIYRQFLPYCDQALITRVEYTYDADTFMVDLEKEGWTLDNESDEQTAFDLIYHYRLYVKPEEE